ncbi:MAG TPA: C45 family autoproteolytic acyltransferase/hydrolase [Ottowia sp.]|uniref:C45 family peptidase n=1 Tax=Ottowia sp. TaxID=1898956 RepID=UPI002C2FFB84|nr:C45 family peptidase [Ottowia sp.]HMN22135.1 C45 family autoproteolytic acyltransferase/hydrolase [Ottowia sp.]
MLSWLQATGSPHDIGRALGRWGAAACHEHLLRSDAWASVQRWHGSTEAAALHAQLQRAFPWVLQELEGLAAGLELPLAEVVLWNCRGDLWAMAPDGCTTVLAPDRLTHNEDGDPGFGGRCGLVQARPDTGPAFTSFVYPGSIPGHTFAVSETGLAMTVNNVRAHRATPGVPRMVLTRAALALASPAEVIALLRAHARAGAFHLGLGRAGMGATVGVEFSHLAVTTQEVRTGTRAHANHAIHTGQQELAQTITASSGARQRQADRLLAEGVDALAILADRREAEPIYRDSPHDTDNENTLATADIDLRGDTVHWRVYARPGQPQFELDGVEPR